MTAYTVAMDKVGVVESKEDRGGYPSPCFRVPAVVLLEQVEGGPSCAQPVKVVIEHRGGLYICALSQTVSKAYAFAWYSGLGDEGTSSPSL